MEAWKKLKFYVIKFFGNNKIIGVVHLSLFVGTIITATIWLKYNKQELEPITIIFGSIIAIIDILKIIVTMPNLPKLTFSEYKSTSRMEASFFMGITLTNVDEALHSAKEENKGLFMVIYDNNHSTKSQLNYSLGYFTQYEMTKRLINEHFIQAIISTDTYEVNKFIPNDYPMENCLLIVLDKNGKIIRQEGVYANSDEGLKKVRQDIEKINVV
jgi:hypothetical protein